MQMPHDPQGRGTIAMDWHTDEQDVPYAHFIITAPDGHDISFDMDRGEVRAMVKDMADLLMEMTLHVTAWVAFYDARNVAFHIMEKKNLEEKGTARTLCGVHPPGDGSWEMRPMEEEDAPSGEEEHVCQVCVSLYQAKVAGRTPEASGTQTRKARRRAP